MLGRGQKDVKEGKKRQGQIGGGRTEARLRGGETVEVANSSGEILLFVRRHCDRMLGGKVPLVVRVTPPCWNDKKNA